MIDIKEVDTHGVMSSYDASKNTTVPRLFRYELAKILGLRQEQIARGAQPLVEIDGKMSVRDVVLKELREKALPFMICRTLPNNIKEYWKLEDLEIDFDTIQL